MSLFLNFEHLDQAIKRSSEQTPLNDVSVDIDVPVSGQRGDVTQQSSQAGNHQGQFRMHCKLVGVRKTSSLIFQKHLTVHWPTLSTICKS